MSKVYKWTDSRNHGFIDANGVRRVATLDSEVELTPDQARKLADRCVYVRSGSAETVAAPTAFAEAEFDLSAHWRTVTKYVDECSDLGELASLLARESASDEPRKSVIDAINARVAELQDA